MGCAVWQSCCVPKHLLASLGLDVTGYLTHSWLWQLISVIPQNSFFLCDSKVFRHNSEFNSKLRSEISAWYWLYESCHLFPTGLCLGWQTSLLLFITWRARYKRHRDDFHDDFRLNSKDLNLFFTNKSELLGGFLNLKCAYVNQESWRNVTSKIDISTNEPNKKLAGL